MMKILTSSQIDNRQNLKISTNTPKSKSNKIFEEYDTKNKQNCFKSAKYKLFQQQYKNMVGVCMQQQRILNSGEESKLCDVNNNKGIQQKSSNLILNYYQNQIENLKQIIKFYKTNSKEQQLKHRIKQLQKENTLMKEYVLKIDKQCKMYRIQLQKNKEYQQILVQQIKSNQQKQFQHFLLLNNYQNTCRDYQSLKQPIHKLIVQNMSYKKHQDQLKNQILTLSTVNSRLQNQLNHNVKQLELNNHLNKDQQLKIQRLYHQIYQQKKANSNHKTPNSQINKTEDQVNFDSNCLSKVIRQNKHIINKQKQIQKKNDELETCLFSSKLETSSNTKQIKYLTKQLIKLKKYASPTNLDRLTAQFKQTNSSRSPLKKQYNCTIIDQKINRVPNKNEKDWHKVKN